MEAEDEAQATQKSDETDDQAETQLVEEGEVADEDVKEESENDPVDDDGAVLDETEAVETLEAEDEEGVMMDVNDAGGGDEDEEDVEDGALKIETGESEQELEGVQEEMETNEEENHALEEREDEVDNTDEGRGEEAAENNDEERVEEEEDVEVRGEEEDDQVEEDLEESAETIDEASAKTKQHELVSAGIATRKRTLSQSSVEDGPKRKVGRNVGETSTDSDDSKHDKFCWVCHKTGVQVNCKVCPRSYHTKCMSMDYPNANTGQGYPCPECVAVMNAETIELRSDAMKQLTLDQLMGLLKNVCLRMRQTPGADPFVKPVDPNDAEDYFDYIVYPMDIETLERNIKKRLYGSTEGFLGDAQWLVHNSIVFNSASSSYTLHAKRLLKVCKQELTEIETCPECYLNAHEKPDSWFLEACRRPHILVWAKLKGFPFWPAKAMKIKDSDVDVRFFGQHDRAWVSMKDCYLYSEEMPVATPKKNNALVSAIEELTAHVEKLKAVHGPVIFAPVKTTIGPELSVEQIRRMLPEYTPPGKPKNKKPVSNPSANNNNNNKAQQPAPKKSPMTIRISSLKTNPTIVNNSAVLADDSGESAETRVVTRLTRKSSAAAQQNQSAGVSESEHSTDENQAGETNLVKDEQAESVPEDNTNGTDEEATNSVPKGSEILANALGGPLRRSTRGMSRSGDGSSHPVEPLTGAAASATEKRLTRSSVKGGSGADTGNETDESGGQTTEEQPPDSVLEAMGLSKKPRDSPSASQKLIHAKAEPLDQFNDSEGELHIDTTPKASNKNSHILVEQLSAHSTTVKPGYRFNLSKDISISAVDGGGGGGVAEQAEDYEISNSSAGSNIRIKRANPPVGPQRGVPHAIPMAVAGGVRPRVQTNSSLLNGQQAQRFNGPLLRQFVRNARPQHILNPRTGQTVRIAGVPSANRPVSLLTVRGQQQQHIIGQKSTKDNSGAVDPSLVNPVQGPITLPGGTITVTPLSLMNAGIINVQQQSSGGTTIVNNPGTTGGKVTKSGITTVQQRRNLMSSIPPSVSMHLQNLTKAMGDMVKQTVEQITLEVIEFCNNTQGKAEASRLQSEVERLQNKLKQEVTDVKHNNDIAMRELRITMENEKKRAIAELKRQLDGEKQKAVEETKKKQWCASCGREALFYCCWNTSYCGYPCQEEHWPSHMASCSQNSR